MDKEELHRYISESTGNGSNICQITAIRNGETVYEDCWHGFTPGDAMNVNSVTKGVMALLFGIALDSGTFKPRIFDRVEFIEEKVLTAIEW